MNNLNNNTGLEIAVVGMAGKFPGARNIAEYWGNLSNGVESISFFSDEELKLAGVPPNLINKSNYVKASGFLENFDKFDAAFFGYSPTDAELLDPQIRLAHESVYEALEDSGINPYQYNGSIGLIMGCSTNPEWLFSVNSDTLNYYSTYHLSNSSFLATKISHKLNLKGPSYVIQTACSSSLVAVHQACQSLIMGESDICLAGGVSINNLNKRGYLYQEGLILSSDGHCKPFDNSGDGTVGGNGIGVVVLKTLEDALNDGDKIYAVIKGSGVNNDGNRKIDYTAPSVRAQADLIRSVHYLAETPPESISYIEAHGTGTNIGDPIEIEALKLAFSTEKRNFCAIGSVKGNIGHLDNAAGIAGFIKTVMALYNKKIVPSINCKKPNEKIDFKKSPFYINTELKEWQESNYPLRAGVSSFGVGGTNVHVVLEQASFEQKKTPKHEHNVIILSAKSKDALKQSKLNLIEYLSCNQDENITDIAYTLQVGRAGFNFRETVVCSEINEAIEKLTASYEQNSFSVSNCPNPIFMFPGQGSQYVNMANDLYKKNDYFKDQLDICLDFLMKEKGINLKKYIFPYLGTDIHETEINQTSIAQPLIFSIEYALTKLLMHMGIYPKAMIGHSIGEYVAACVAGVFSLNDALSLVFERGKLMQECIKGGMLAIFLSEEDIVDLLKDTNLSLAAANSPHLNVVSGNTYEINNLKTKLDELKIACKQLHTSHAYHSAMVEPVMNDFKILFNDLVLNKPQIPYISNLDGNWINEEKVITSDYWVDHLRQTVRFVNGLSTLLKEENSLYIEVGPGNSLISLLKSHNSYKQVKPKTLNTLRHVYEKKLDTQFFFESLGKAWNYGVNIFWENIYSKDITPKRISLPSYPFEQFRFNAVLNNKKGSNIIKLEDNLKENIDNWFYRPSWIRKEKLRKNNIEGENIWLVFSNSDEISKNTIEILNKNSNTVVQVIKGDEYKCINNTSFILNPDNEINFVKLFEALKKVDSLPDNILYFWSFDKEEKTDSLEDYYDFINLSKSIGTTCIDSQIKLGVVSNHLQSVMDNDDELFPLKSILLGPLYVLSQEYPNVTTFNIDLRSYNINSIITETTLSIINEFNELIPNNIIAIRQGYRWIKCVDKIEHDGIKSNIELRNNGLYLITGGLGKIGLSFAEYIAKKNKSIIVLIGRSVFPKEENWDEWLSTHSESESISIKIRKLQKIKRLGSKIIICKADIANRDQMKTIVSRIEKKYNNINGVFHAAGIIDCIVPLKKLTKDEINKQLTAKVDGTIVLEEIFQKADLDFCLICSSISSLIGGYGFSAYAGANIFMDNYITKNNHRNNNAWKVLNLDAWSDVSKEGTEVNAITNNEAYELFNHILTISCENQIYISTINLNNRINFLHQKKIACLNKNHQEIILHDRPNISNSYIAARTDIEKKLARIWQEILSIKKIGINDDFFELGGHSLLATQTITKIRTELNIELPLKIIFENSTISELSEKIKGGNFKTEDNKVEKAERLSFQQISPEKEDNSKIRKKV